MGDAFYLAKGCLPMEKHRYGNLSEFLRGISQEGSGGEVDEGVAGGLAPLVDPAPRRAARETREPFTRASG